MLGAPPLRRVPEVPGQNRRKRPGGSRHPPDPRQRKHPQDAPHSALARQATPLPPSLHTDQRLLAQSGRTLVRRPDREAAPSRCAPQHAGPRRSDLRLRRCYQSRAKAIHLDQDRRSDPRQRRQILPADFRLRTLADCRQLLGELTRLGDHHASGELAVTGFVVDAEDSTQIAEAPGSVSLSFPVRPAQGTSVVNAVTGIGYGGTLLILVFDDRGRLRATSPWNETRLSGEMGPVQIALALARDSMSTRSALVR